MFEKSDFKTYSAKSLKNQKSIYAMKVYSSWNGEAYDMLGYTFKGRYHKVLKFLKLKKSRKKSKLLMSSAMLRFRKQEYYSMLVTNENC